MCVNQAWHGLLAPDTATVMACLNCACQAQGQNDQTPTPLPEPTLSKIKTLYMSASFFWRPSLDSPAAEISNMSYIAFHVSDP